jgi:diguanylate cyclase (GGDEF)-like protein
LNALGSPHLEIVQPDVGSCWKYSLMLDDLSAHDGDPSTAERDQMEHPRDRAADRRDLVGELRDDFGDARDAHGARRDVTGGLRDLAGAERDLAADRRDRLAAAAELSITPPTALDARRISVQARKAAASDRRQASQDRVAGAVERTKSGADRQAGADERLQSELDRSTALADRAAAAVDRSIASIDGLTGAHARDAGLVELERELDRAQSDGRRFSLAFVDVNHLKVLNDSHGHAAGDRALVEVVEAIRATVRSYDLIVRVGGDEFLCGLPGLGRAAALRRFTRLNADLADGARPASVTVGVAEMVAGEAPAALIARADADPYTRRGRERSASR